MRALVISAVSLGLSLSILAAPAPVQRSRGWTMFGGNSSRNAVSHEKNPPLHWEVEGKERKNIKWEADLGNKNCAAPVVSGGLIWVGTNNDRPRDPAVK